MPLSLVRALALLLLPVTALVLGGSAVTASAQEQPPGALSATAVPPESWDGVSLRLARSLVDEEARAKEDPLFLPKATLRRFGRAETRTPLELRNQFEGWRVISVETFEYPGGQMVAETATSLARLRREDSGAIPEAVVQALTPLPAEAPAAEQTATRWVTAALSPQRGDRVAMMVLWNPNATDQPVFERLSFVLIKAGRLPDGRYRVQSLAYGTAQQAALEGF